MLDSDNLYRRPTVRPSFFLILLKKLQIYWHKGSLAIKRKILLISRNNRRLPVRRRSPRNSMTGYDQYSYCAEKEQEQVFSGQRKKVDYSRYQSEESRDQTKSRGRQRAFIAPNYGGRHSKKRNINSFGRPKRPFLRAILCGAILWAILPFGLMTLQQSGRIQNKDLPNYSITAQKVVSQNNNQVISNKEIQWQNFTGNLQVRLIDHKTGQLLNLDLEEYVVGVVAAEMPASFGLEALKAQAVAARTYAMKRIIQGASSQVLAANPQAQLTSDHLVNQAWIDQKERETRWGNNFPGNEGKIRQAVEATKGIILLYKGEIIDTLYHASCGGEKTENIENVWGGKEVPYLQSVACSGHEDKYCNHLTKLTLQEADERLGTSLNTLPAAALSGSKSQDQCQIETRTKAGQVISMNVLGKTFSGFDIRAKLDLPSTNFQTKINQDYLEITSQGYGHGVGLCQYGAADFAAKGDNWQQIVTHYYQGVQPARMVMK